nr:hypothetical protein [Tanacetum cinerariifolium]
MSIFLPVFFRNLLVTTVRWYLRAAEGGHVHAMYEVAMCYASGRGIAQDRQQSRKWMKLSADDGYKKAQFEHGRTLFLVTPTNTTSASQ